MCGWISATRSRALLLLVAVSLALASDASGFEPRLPRPLAVPNADFERGLAGWSAEGRVQAQPGGYSGAAAALLPSPDRPATIASSPVRPAPNAGPGVLATVWLSLSDGARAAVAIDVLQAGHWSVLAERRIAGPTPGWVPCRFAANEKGKSRLSAVRIKITASGNGRVLVDDASLKSLPPDEPVYTGPPPAPPRGQVQVRGGHLVDGRGRRIRLWGVNCVDAPNRTYPEMEFIARRVRQMGFNAVRLHLDDFRLIDTEARNSKGEPTSLKFRTARRGDGSVLDRWDYFVYCLEREGLYIYMTFDRFGAKFQPGDYHVLPSAGEEDAREWKRAVVELQRGRRADEHVYFVDPRLGAAQARYVRMLLNHRNAYTGRRIADDPYVALYELTNENGFVPFMLEGRFRQWPQYFQGVLQRRFNEWLRSRYGTDEALRRAWGRLEPGESLAKSSVQVAPTLGEADKYPRARLADFIRFVNHLFTSYSRRLEEIIRSAGSCSARAPITWDTIFEHKFKWYWPCSGANLMTVGTYVQGSYKPDISRLVMRPSFFGFYNLSFASVLGKPTVIYETNAYKPYSFRAEYPLILAAFASTHDWDGVFWYNWADGTVRWEYDADCFWLTGLRYAAVTHVPHGLVTSTDEVLLASIRAAGQIFTSFALPATDPVVVTIGSRDLYGPALWTGDISLPYPEDAPKPWPRARALQATDLLHTVRYRFDETSPATKSSRPLIPRIPDPCSPVPGLSYRLSEHCMKLQVPAAVAFVGEYRRAVDLGPTCKLELTAPPEPPFVCFALASEDGRPLSQCRRASLVLTTFGENRGRRLRERPESHPAKVPLIAKIVASWGYGPPLIARPGARIMLPRWFNWRVRDFRLRIIARGRGKLLEIPQGQEIFFAELWR